MLLAVVLAGASIAAGMNWQKQSRATSAQLPALTAQLEQSRVTRAELEKTLKPGTPAVGLDAALAAFLAQTAADAPARRVRLADAPGANAAVKEPVEAPGLAGARLTLGGRFEAYPELVAYLQGLQQGPHALVRLTVQGDSFEASFRVFGLAS